MLRVERRIITAVIQAAERAGFVPVQFWDGEEYQPITWKCDSTETNTAQRIANSLTAIESVDEGTLHFAPKSDLQAWGNLGVMFILGNGVDVIHDYHDHKHPPKRGFSDAVHSVCMTSDNYL